jgi:hypothetical protein
MHNRTHSNGISEEQLKQLLGSLPKAKAPVNLESRLLQRISAEHLNVAQTLSTLAPVSAHPDFEERLFRAIREHKRRGAVVTPIAGGTTFASLLQGFGWFRTGVAAGAAILLAIGGSVIYHGLQPAAQPASPEQSRAAVKQEQPAEHQMPRTQSAEQKPAVTDQTEAAVVADAPVLQEHPAHASQSPRVSRKATAVPGTTVIVPQNAASTAAPVQTTATEVATKQSNPTTIVVLQDSVAGDQQNTNTEMQNGESDDSVVHTGDSVNTGGDPGNQKHEETPATPDSDGVKH